MTLRRGLCGARAVTRRRRRQGVSGGAAGLLGDKGAAQQEAAKVGPGSTRFAVPDAVKLVQCLSMSALDETVEVALGLGIDAKVPGQMLRGVVRLPHGTGKRETIAVFARGDKAEEARKAGADIVGAEDLVAMIEGGKIPFTKCVATPDMMPVIGKLGRILGPKGLMPNPKTATLTADVSDAVQKLRMGQITYRVEKSGSMQAALGKVSFPREHLIDNVTAFLREMLAIRPAKVPAKSFIKSITLCSQQGPAVRLDISKTVQYVNQ